VVLVLFAGVSLVALSTMTPQTLADPINGWARDPIAGIANGISLLVSPNETAASITSSTEAQIILSWLLQRLRDALPVLVAILAATILTVSTNAGLLGISRLTYNLSSRQQLPATLSRVHYRFRTPYIAIILFCGVSLLMLVPGFISQTFFSDLGALYVFGSLLCFALAHAAILALRWRRPDLKRPFKLGWNVRLFGHRLPMTAILGLLATATVWVIIMVIQPFSRYSGILWMIVGFMIYFVYRRSRRMPLTHRDSDKKTK